MRVLVTILVAACLGGTPMVHAQQLSYLPAPTEETASLTLPPFTPPANEGASRTRALEGALVGFVVGTAATVIITRSGGSTAPCDSSANQDALSTGECIGIAAAGGLVGAGVGALIGSRIRVSALQALPPLPLGPAGMNGRLAVVAVSVVTPFN